MKFEDRYYYEASRDTVGASYTWRSIQDATVTRKVAFFAWTLVRILTMVNRYKQNMLIGVFKYKNTKESVEHL